MAARVCLTRSRARPLVAARVARRSRARAQQGALALAPVPAEGASPKAEAVVLPSAPAQVSVGAGASSDVVVQGTLVSDAHATLSLESSGAVTVVDNGSTNGKWVRGKRINTATLVRLGDMVSFAGADVLVDGCEPYRLAPTAEDGQPALRMLGRVAFPGAVKAPILNARLYNWASTLTQDGNLPLVLPLRVDAESNGVRLALCTDGQGGEALTELCALRIVLEEGAGDEEDLFVSIWLMRGTSNEAAVPDLPLIMSSLQTFLKASVNQAVRDMRM